MTEAEQAALAKWEKRHFTSNGNYGGGNYRPKPQIGAGELSQPA